MTRMSLIATIAERMVPAHQANLPLDLNALARSLGARDVLYRSSNLQGYTEWSANGPIVRLSVGRSDGRRRFVLAHECAHLALDPVITPPSFDAAAAPTHSEFARAAEDRLGDLSEYAKSIAEESGIERFCDKVAAELLLPAREIPGILSRIRGIGSLQKVSDEYRVSLSMLVTRLNEFAADEICLLRLEETNDGSWIALSAIGAPAGWRGRVVSFGTSAGAFNSLVGHTAETRVHLRSASADVTVSAEAQVWRRSALVMCNPRDLDAASRADQRRPGMPLA